MQLLSRYGTALIFLTILNVFAAAAAAVVVVVVVMIIMVSYSLKGNLS